MLVTFPQFRTLHIILKYKILLYKFFVKKENQRILSQRGVLQVYVCLFNKFYILMKQKY